MNDSFQEIGEDKILQSFPDESQVWIYQLQTDHSLSPEEIIDIQEKVKHFASHWEVHGKPIEAFGDFLFGTFIVFSVSANDPASGCSIDNSVAFIKSLMDEYQVDFLNRLQVAYIDSETGKIRQENLKSLKEKLRTNEIPSTSFFFNNTVKNKKELDGQWIIPFEGSWLLNR